jgi:hypothetical protein
VQQGLQEVEVGTPEERTPSKRRVLPDPS